jgi:hypothetical protein
MIDADFEGERLLIDLLERYESDADRQLLEEDYESVIMACAFEAASLVESVYSELAKLPT